VTTCIWIIVDFHDPKVDKQGEWFILAGLTLDSSNFDIYIQAFFFIVSTTLGMGWGDTYPENNTEYIISVIIMFVGILMSGLFFSFFLVQISISNATVHDNNRKLEETMNLAKQLNIKKQTKVKMQKYYRQLRLSHLEYRN
jgi:hypothetical protein